MLEFMTKKKWIATIVGVVLAIALIVTLIVVLVKPAEEEPIFVERENISVTVDVGVSVTLKLNSEYAVTEANALLPGDSAYADDLGGYVPFTVSFGKLISKLQTDGKFEGKADEVILITIESIKHNDYEGVLKIINNVLEKKECKAKVITLYIRAKEQKIIDLADKYGISYGKAYLCNKLAKESKKLDAEDLATKTLAEIYRLAKEDKSESHISSVVSDLNSSQEEIELPKDESSSEPTSSEDASSGDTSSEDTTPSDTSSETPSDTPSNDTSSGGQSFGTDSGGSGWISGWY